MIRSILSSKPSAKWKQIVFFTILVLWLLVPLLYIRICFPVTYSQNQCDTISWNLWSGTSQYLIDDHEHRALCQLNVNKYASTCCHSEQRQELPWSLEPSSFYLPSNSGQSQSKSLFSVASSTNQVTWREHFMGDLPGQVVFGVQSRWRRVSSQNIGFCPCTSVLLSKLRPCFCQVPFLSE